MDYGDLQDNNYNSWNAVEEYDRYLTDAVVGNATPRLIGTDGDGPLLQTQAVTPATVGNIGEAVLYADSSNSISITAVHVTDDQDGDSIYTPDTTANYALSATADMPLGYVWGFDPDGTGTATANVPAANSALVVIKLNDDDININDAIAYVYRPVAEELDDFQGGTVNTTIVASGELSLAGGLTNQAAGGVGAAVAGDVGMRNDDDNNGGNDTLVVELPGVAGVSSTDILVIQNVLGPDDVYYSIHIAAPEAIATTVAPSTTEPTASATIYKQVFLADATNNGLAEIQSGTQFGAAVPDYSASVYLTYREGVDTAVASWTKVGTDDDAGEADLDQINFSASASDTNGYVTITLDPVAAGSLTESTNKIVGNDAELTVTATDFSGQSSTVLLTLQKGHGTQAGIGAVNTGTADLPILNIISGDVE